MGDANAQVGNQDKFFPIIGKKQLHQETNNTVEKLINFAPARGLVTVSTMFQHNEIHLRT
jgi:hypothetical protein